MVMENESLFKNINLVVGLVITALSLIVLIFSTATLISLIILLSISFLFVGFGRIYNGFINETLNRTSKFAKYITGALSVIISIVMMILALTDPSLAILIFTNLFGYTLLFIGISRIGVGYLMESYPKQYRAALIIIGIITFIFSFLILVFPVFGYFILVMLISLSLLINGLIRISLGLIVKKIKS